MNGLYNLGHQPSVATVSVWKRVDRNKPVVKSRGDLIEAIRLLLNPELGIIEEWLKSDQDVFFWHSGILICETRFSCPLPNVSEHSLMQIKTKRHIQTVMKFSTECPSSRLENVIALELVQLSLICDVAWYQAREFVRI